MTLKHLMKIENCLPASRCEARRVGKLKIAGAIIVVLFFISYSLFSLFAYAATKTTFTLTVPSNNLGLVGYWNLNDGSGASATDSSGNGNTGTLENMEAEDWVAGKFGKALSFDNTGNERVVAGNGASLQITNGTMAAWIKTSGDRL